MRLIGALLAVAACLVLLVTGSAIADDEGGNSNASLKGKFRFSLNKSCTDTATGALVHIYFIGVTTYDGNGGATTTDRGMILFPRSNSFLTFEEKGDSTYEVKRNGSFIEEGTFTGTDGTVVTGAKTVGQIDARRVRS